MADNENQELKAGHPPATKVGGMRVVQHKPPKEDTPPKMTAEEKEEFGEDPKKPSGGGASSVVVSGVEIKDSDAFPKEAVKSFHEKPLPTHQKVDSHQPTIIHQPRK
ncbi:hypothetical protein TCAL_10322 [Tigriopus californicus]|uniref:Death-associated protein 1 n=2 Tax=Tigriopus californicus TaxID=6832 RepID=A0A553NFE9_TIGCA|nr:hypothetical protein TCAL_10322 [Tigriopus californicus]